MKSMRKVIPALALLLVSAVILSSASYAWFSMNTQVTATGMQVTAKSKNTFLLIGTGTNSTADLIQAANPNTTVALTVENTDVDVYPSKPMEAADVGTGKLFESGTEVINATTAAAVGNWFTAQNTNPADANDTVKNATALTSENFADYVIKKTVYLTIADGADTTHNLTVTPTIALKDGETGTDISAVKFLLQPAVTLLFLIKICQQPQSLHGTADFDIVDDDVVTVDIYIYYDEMKMLLTTNNVADLAAATISLSFDVEVGVAA